MMLALTDREEELWWTAIVLGFVVIVVAIVAIGILEVIIFRRLKWI